MELVINGTRIPEDEDPIIQNQRDQQQNINGM